MIDLKPLIYIFDCNGHNAPAYSCNKPGDNTGSYVHLTDYEDLQTQLTAAREELERLKNQPCEHPRAYLETDSMGIECCTLCETYWD